jgi:hypothetical protein
LEETIIINNELSCVFCELLDEPPEGFRDWCEYCDQVTPVLRLLRELDMV